MESQQTFKLEPISEEEELAHHEKEFAKQASSAIISRKFSMTRRSKQAPAGVEDFDEKRLGSLIARVKFMKLLSINLKLTFHSKIIKGIKGMPKSFNV